MQQLMGVGWFPGPEWAAALERWPDLADEMPVDHDQYLAAVEARLRRIRGQAAGVRFVFVPLAVAELEAFAAERGLDPGSGEARGQLAADGARLGRGTPWPPGRNDACWCGSGEKYKRCCAARPLADPPPGAER